MKDYRLGFIGCGHMGMAMARGACRILNKEDIAVYDPSDKVMMICETEGFRVFKDINQLCNMSQITVLAVRPQDIDTVLEEMKDASSKVILSIVTGVSISYLQDKLNNVPVIRAMPNTPLQINKGSTAICCSSNCPDEAYKFVKDLFSSMGKCKEIPEEKLNSMVCVHGSIPAYVYYLTECILEDMKKRGFKEEEIRELLVETIIGSGELMKMNPDKPLSVFVDEVCSKGGTTIEAIDEMKNRGMDRIISDANEKCINRAEQLGK